MMSKFAQLTKPGVSSSKAEAAMMFAESINLEKKSKNQIEVKGTIAPAGHKRLTINLPEELHKKLRLKAVEEETTATEIIERLLNQGLK
jgi:hypothetical protein